MIHELRFKEEKKFKRNENGITFFSPTERKKINVMFYCLTLFVIKRKNIHEYKI